MADRAVTLQQVAEAAGVHAATASRALNPATRSKVNDQTATRILEASKKLGYRGNPMARGLRTSRSMTVGVLIPDLTNPFYPPLVRGIDDGLDTMGYVPLLANSDDSPIRELTLLESMRDRHVDGFIIATARVNDPAIRSIVAEGLPVVLVSRTVKGLKVPSVTLDDELAIEMAVDHLVDLGHSSIGHIAGPQDSTTGIKRKAGFLRACRSHGIKNTAIVETTRFSEDQGRIASARLLDQHYVTAIVASNDLIALGALATLAERRLNCPEDISVIGVNDMAYLDRIAPPLTTIHTDTYQMGLSAAQLLLSIIGGTKSDVIENRVLRPHLVLRKSTDVPPSKAKKGK
ncbi:MAG: LacI family DNA-binding transcriptional regulator [Candidatus Nanopelagicaceae bacterium]|nr:LacI family DNA-binding transcriptional regulator [Candidatus Nanopelagicaceae bacterium]